MFSIDPFTMPKMGKKEVAAGRELFDTNVSSDAAELSIRAINRYTGLLVIGAINVRASLLALLCTSSCT